MVRKDVMLAQKLRNEAEDSLSFLRSHTSTIHISELKKCQMKAYGFILLFTKILEREYIYLEEKNIYSSNVNKTNSSFQIKPINILLEFQEKIIFS